MAKIDFTLWITNYTDSSNVGGTRGETTIIVSAPIPNISGTPQFRVYLENALPGNWEPMSFWSSANNRIGYRNVIVLSPGKYKLEFKDDFGQRQLAKFSVFSNDELLCLGLINNFFLPMIGVSSIDGVLQVIGYGNSADGSSEMVSVNDGPFKSWSGSSGATWTSAELEALGVDSKIDKIRFSVTGKCTLVIAEDLHFGEPSVPSDVEASYTKTDCTAPGVNDGTITVEVSGGSENYTFQWDDGPTTQNRTNLAPGFYSVTITDTGTGQVVILSNIEITAPPPVSEDVTEEITIEVRRPSCEGAKAVYLCWLNSLGGWDQWLFEDKNNTFENEVTTRTDEEFSKYVEKLDSVQSVSNYLSRTVRRTMRIGTGKLTIAQMAGFSELFTSTSVLMLASPPDVRPPQWVGVRVKDGSFRYNEQTQEAEVTIELPDLVTQTN